MARKKVISQLKAKVAFLKTHHAIEKQTLQEEIVKLNQSWASSETALRRDISMLNSKIFERDIEIKRLKTKKWYQFFPADGH